jgi:hypothetical protein
MASVKSAKNDILGLLQKLPDDVTYEDIQYHIYVRQKIELGLEAAERGETLTQRAWKGRRQ